MSQARTVAWTSVCKGVNCTKRMKCKRYNAGLIVDLMEKGDPRHFFIGYTNRPLCSKYSHFISVNSKAHSDLPNWWNAR